MNNETVLFPNMNTNNTGHLYITVFWRGQAKTYDLFRFGKASISFGKKEDNDIVIESPIVSRYHGFFVYENNMWIIRDNNSLNGLITNEGRVYEAVLQNNLTVNIDTYDRNHDDGVVITVSDSLFGDKWTHYQLSGNSIVTIGRSPNSSICIEHVTVSANHARIFYSNGYYFIEDANSTNGTYVNGRRVTGKTRLSPKDVIQITNTKLIFNKDRLTYCTFKSGVSLETINVTKAVKSKESGEKILVDGINISIEPCELVAIVGGSGAGKSTFMNCISGYKGMTGGQVLINGEDLLDNYNVYKSIIAYVPQQDTVYDDLTLKGMLTYSAKLRMPSDTTKEEIEKRVDEVISMVDLSERKDLLISRLSGGQKKRASIAVELLSDPSLFFLDEPTSGLDPGTEKNFMYSMRDLAQNGKTVILVTHTTQNIGLCDKVVFLGPGGKLCFFGAPDECLKFFGVKDFTDIYNMTMKDPQGWQMRFRQYSLGHNKGYSNTNEKTVQKPKKKSPFRQFFILSKRYFELIFRDKQRLLLLMLQAPLVGVLLGIISESDAFEVYDSAKSSLFVLTCAAIWIGCSNTIQEVCKERTILAREYMADLWLGSYIMSKMAVMAVICFVQSLSLVVILSFYIEMDYDGLLMPYILEFTITTFLINVASSAMGLFVSSLNKNADRAMGMVPILLIPQILFSGILFVLDGVTKGVSYIAISKWGMEALGTTANLNALVSQMQIEMLKLGIDHQREVEEMFDFSKSHFFGDWGVLLFFTTLCLIGSIIALHFNLKEK